MEILFALAAVLGPFVVFVVPCCFGTIWLVIMLGIVYFFTMRNKNVYEVETILCIQDVVDHNTTFTWKVKHIETGKTMWFSNGGILFAGKFRGKVLKIQSEFEENTKYRLTVIGAQNLELGVFQNIIKAEKI